MNVRRRAAAVAVAGLLVAGCAGESNPLEIGLRRISLDLAFRDADKALPVDPQLVITRILPAEFTPNLDDVLEEDEPTATPRQRTVIRFPPPPARTPPCVEADPTATPDRQAFAVVKDPPQVGTYPRRNQGELDVTFATFNFQVPYPATSVWDIPRVEPGNAPVAVGEREEPVAPVPEAVKSNTTAAPPNFEFDVIRKAAPGYQTTDTYSYTFTGVSGGDYLYLKRRVTIANGAESTFVPTPPIRIVRLGVSPGGDGTTSSASNHAGIDRTTNVAMTIQSDIIGREEIDVCGEVVDTYVVKFQERVVNLAKQPPDVSGNEPDKFNVWNIQFDNGLLLVRESVDTVTRTSATVPGTPAPVPIEIKAKYTSTLRSLTPLPLGTPPPREASPFAPESSPGSPDPEEE